MKEDLIKFFLKRNGALNSNLINKNNNKFDKEKFDEVLKITAFADRLNPSFAKRLKMIEQDIESIPLCPSCGEEVHLGWNSTLAFNKFCSVKCSANCKDTTEQKIKTKIEKYGKGSVTSKRESKYTVEYVNSVLPSIEKYQNRITALKINADKSWTYRCSYHEHEFNVKHLRDVLKGTSNCPNCRTESLSKRYIDTQESFESKLKLVKGDQIKIVDVYKGSHVDTKFSCNEHGEFISKPYQMLQDQNCPKCYNGVSKQEESLVDYVKSLVGDDILTNSRRVIKNKEIDIFYKGLGIEYNGSYWHCDRFIDKRYHLDKTKQMEALGYELLHIWSFEWLNPIQRKIWESVIKSKLKLTDKVYARKCKIVSLTPSVFANFMNENHLQGNLNSSHKYGLEHEGELIAVIGLSSPRFDNSCDIEITRYATKLNTTCVGGFSKLLSHFIKSTNFKGAILSYADRRLSTGNVYTKNGFDFVSESEPNYLYSKDWVNFLSRYQCQKHKLRDLLEVFDENKSEYENMTANNYYRMYDCGNLVFKKIVK